VFLTDRHFVRWVEVFGSALERVPVPPGQQARRRAWQHNHRTVPQHPALILATTTLDRSVEPPAL
jgi:hypothetical protein